MSFFIDIARHHAAAPRPPLSELMKQFARQLANKPLFLAAILSVPLWIVFGNYLVGAMAALLAAFFIAMCHSLYLLNKRGKDTAANNASPGDERPR